MNEEQKVNASDSRKKVVTVLIILLAALSCFFIYNLYSSSKYKKEAQQLINLKEDELSRTMADLQGFKGKNAQLDSMIDLQIAELQMQSAKVDSLVASGKITQSQLAQLRQENKGLKNLRTKYLSQIDSLISANEKLLVENSGLKTDLRAASERTEKLIDENAKLYSKVNVATALKAESIVAEGIRARNSGREVSTNRARNTEKLKVCFNIMANEVAEPGDKEIYLRIIGPDGATLYIESEGSGKMMFQGTEQLYSTKGLVDYTSKETAACIAFNKGSAFQEGKYKVELYNNGSIMGTSEFELR